MIETKNREVKGELIMPPLTYTDEQFIEALEQKPSSSSGTVANIVGCKPRNANIRLMKLHKKGLVALEVESGRYKWSAAK